MSLPPPHIEAARRAFEAIYGPLSRTPDPDCYFVQLTVFTLGFQAGQAYAEAQETEDASEC